MLIKHNDRNRFKIKGLDSWISSTVPAYLKIKSILLSFLKKSSMTLLYSFSLYFSSINISFSLGMEAKVAGFSGVLIHLQDLLADHVLMGWTAVWARPFISSLRSPFVDSNVIRQISFNLATQASWNTTAWISTIIYNTRSSNHLDLIWHEENRLQRLILFAFF